MEDSNEKDSLSKTVSQAFGEALDEGGDIVGSTVFGPLWPLLKPFARAVKILSVSPADRGLEEMAKKWAAEQERASQRRELTDELVRALRADQETDRNDDLILAARTQATMLVAEASRRLLLRMQCNIGFDLGLDAGEFLRGVSPSAARIKRNLVVLGFEGVLTSTVIAALLAGETSVLDDLRTAISCQLHPLVTLMFEVGLRVGHRDQAGLDSSAGGMLRELGLGFAASLEPFKVLALGEADRAVETKVAQGFVRELIEWA